MPRCKNCDGPKRAKLAGSSASPVFGDDMEDDAPENAETPTAADLFLQRFVSSAIASRALAWSAPTAALLIILDSDERTWRHVQRERKRFAE